MFFNNKSMESLRGLIAEVREYVMLRFEAFRIDLVAGLAALVSGLAVGCVLMGLLAFALLFLSYAAALALDAWIDNRAVAFALVALGYLLLGGLVYVFRRALILRPLTKWLSGILLSPPSCLEGPGKEDEV
ncbi:MAG: phage holin family protein [Bacteroidaceae bacterium]|nr:phage holin family protein [Bacteroidaceae bacterium]